ncbi:tetratricopeptide repeat protein [Lonsdalea quercina]|uniref:tetratricopeptide repeat protein n=1 Tax=Lonsdalea quercina TaxID=71657 RepID=UPI0039761CD3
MPQLALKANEISDELVDILATKTSITEMQFFRYLRDIEKLRDSASEDYLKALANGAFGRKDEAVAFFEEALKQNNALIAENFIVYLNDYGSFREVDEAVNRLVEHFHSPTMLNHAWEANLFMGRISKALYYAEKLRRMSCEKEAELMMNLASSALEQSTCFQQATGLTDFELEDIADRAVDVMTNYKVNPVALYFCFVLEEKTSSYIMQVNTTDPEVLSDMNLDIAFSLAENESFIGKPFSVWFEGHSEDTTRAS